MNLIYYALVLSMPYYMFHACSVGVTVQLSMELMFTLSLSVKCPTWIEVGWSSWLKYLFMS